ncbi:MAG: DNA polymerase II [Syntrophobacteraceae bacterium]|nr:DNA polymerase II [Syntrophobacteraceae bacterium]
MKPLSFEENEILFGRDSTAGIVAVEPAGEDSMRLFIRTGNGLKILDEPFSPFILLEKEDLLDGFRKPYSIRHLSSNNALADLALFTRWTDCIRARDHLRKTTGKTSTSPQAPYLFLSDPVHQHLLLTGKTLFKGMAYSDIRRLAIDIETGCAPGYEFSNPSREEDRILSIALMDNHGFEEVLFGSDMTEKEMIEALGNRILQLDPDVIEGHNIFNFDLEYIVARARRHRVKLAWGRDGSEPKLRRSRFTVAERIIDYTRMDIFGRHIVDTLFLLQYYDMAARELESYGLKAAAQHFGLSEDDRTYVDTSSVQWIFENQPEVLKKYNLDDARETLALSRLLGYPFFLQARIFPYSYQNILIRGNATKINALFMREYLARNTSIPLPSGREEFEGGYTDVFVQGVVKNIVHCDVASLYPSVMLAFHLQPSSDSLGIFLPLLRDLRSFRLNAKQLAREASDPHEHDYYEALQQTFKVLINSFYGYLGTTMHHFSDTSLAAEVTRIGRELIRRMIDRLRREGAVPVEVDTDGIYFVPPPGLNTAEQAAALVARVSETLPEGIRLEMDGTYAAMFSYKRKNYALLDETGQMIIKGSGLRSRGMEKYLREFLSSMLRLLLEGKGHDIQRLYHEYVQKLENHNMDIAQLAKTETLSESEETYRQKVKSRKRNRSAIHELAIASGREYRAGDQISYYVTGKGKSVRVYDNCRFASGYDPKNPDENVEYYKAKLLDLLKKFEEFLPNKISNEKQ